MTDALVPVDVEALEHLPLDAQIDALGTAYRSWRRLEVPAAWAFGCALRRIRDGRPGREWPGIRDRIGITRETARRYILLADNCNSAQIGQFSTVDAAVQAFTHKRIAPAPAPPPPPPAPVDVAVEAVEVPKALQVPDLDAEVEAVAVEAGPTPAELRDERLERLAIITEHLTGEVVNAWAEKFDQQAAREREHVRANRATSKRERAKDRKLSDIRDALLVLPPSPGVDAILAKFYNSARPAAA